ncbi:alkaline phosphatase family protein [Cellulomonas chengniuliangii]|uniref:Alkaline phosphatase family protein n=1 Tax=Cellulomonas chengniuliangii TaxID=2968084 RepID=A0ABY5KXK0_9CELL|nr:nucleotide pyrophosphatase/phosphodiesterase family protein [Cellulomonas chengniuliangii]MCC2308578.1 alkaline phosphatase family protein [Cellulomonas chengniuliangii]UUI73941.1 alkaline phosphatase family protein [Cellulomonas chengniuliangii]
MSTDPLTPARTAMTTPTGADLAAAGLVAPDYAGRHLGGVLPAVADALGVPDVPGGAAARARLGLPRAQRACVVLVDGLGQHNLAERAGHAPFLRSLLAASAPLSAGYPSTTAASLGSFGTGAEPGRTGMVGYTARNPRTGGLANLVSWDGAGPAREWQRETTVFERVTAAGVPVTSVGPARFAGSGLTEAALRGGSYRAAEPLADRVDVALFELMGPALVYLYWGDVDKIGHHHGWGSRQWGDALSALDRELGRLARSLPTGTSLIVTADHGMVDVDRSQRWDVARTPALSEGVQLVAGEPRAVHVHVPAGDDVRERSEEVALRWRETLGDAALVALGDHAVEAGWFGDVAEHVRPLIGDVVVAMRGRATVVDSRTQSKGSMDLVGVHGSLTPAEMAVPFLTVHA